MKALNKLFLIFFLMLPLSLFAYDFGLVLSADGGYGNDITEETSFRYKLDLRPRFSTLIGDNAEFFISGVFSVGNEYGFLYIPELLRTEFNIRFGNQGDKVGRINYTDPLALVADGLFDGVQYYYNSGAGTIRAGAWYTGLLYKKRANIVLGETDEAEYFKPFVFGDFANTYFSSKRVFASVGYEHPSLGELLHLNTAVIGQIDLNGKYTTYNNEYVIVKAGIPIKNFLVELGGAVELSQISFKDSPSVRENGNYFYVSYAADIGLYLLFPSTYNGRLSFRGTISGGKTDSESSKAFTPITAGEYGYILRTKIAGLTVLSLNYSTRINSSLSGSVTASYFVRNDLGTYNDYPVTVSNEGYFLGPEVSAQITWSPVSDLQFNLSGGAFFPSVGDAGKNEKLNWRLDLTAIMLLF